MIKALLGVVMLSLGFLANPIVTPAPAYLQATPPNDKLCKDQTTGCNIPKDLCASIGSCRKCTQTTKDRACETDPGSNCLPGTSVNCGTLYAANCHGGSCNGIPDADWVNIGIGCDDSNIDIWATTCHV